MYIEGLSYNTRSLLLPAMSTAVSAEISAAASAATLPGFAVHKTVLRAAFFLKSETLNSQYLGPKTVIQIL